MYEGKLRCSLIMVLTLATLSTTDETTQRFLENAVRNLKHLRQLQTGENTENPTVRRNYQYAESVPPLSLTKGELTDLYQQAVAKGETIKLDTGEHEYVNAVVHHLDNEPSPHEDLSPHEAGPSEDAGYYYYYYPIKSFLDEITSQPSEEHSHNVTIQTADGHKKEVKPMEPILMAISGFLGMAAMFVLSMMVLPKFGGKPTKVINDIKKKEKLDDFARLAMNAIEGHCAERFACELTKTARSFDVEDNRFYKLLKRVAPGTFGRYMNNSGKYADKQLQCTAIPCTKRKPNYNNNKNHNNQNRNHKNNQNNSNNKKGHNYNTNQKNNKNKKNPNNNNENKQFTRYQSHSV
ncbi:unnamed protein product [Ceutorhynchus assimilis]|uniref:Uncharacterized protein n=1 Tax=Ceutorhynchus assimilis TaxID=467358 RepID=A0A9P0GK34_9CUCU|nr:unnamed protein product [Ceutorhynchus assimilis]